MYLNRGRGKKKKEDGLYLACSATATFKEKQCLLSTSYLFIRNVLGVSYVPSSGMF